MLVATSTKRVFVYQYHDSGTCFVVVACDVAHLNVYLLAAWRVVVTNRFMINSYLWLQLQCF